MTGHPIGPGGGAKVKGLKSLSGDKKALEAFDAWERLCLLTGAFTTSNMLVSVQLAMYTWQGAPEVRGVLVSHPELLEPTPLSLASM